MRWVLCSVLHLRCGGLLKRHLSLRQQWRGNAGRGQRCCGLTELHTASVRRQDGMQAGEVVRQVGWVQAHRAICLANISVQLLAQSLKLLQVLAVSRYRCWPGIPPL